MRELFGNLKEHAERAARETERKRVWRAEWKDCERLNLSTDMCIWNAEAALRKHDTMLAAMDERFPSSSDRAAKVEQYHSLV